MSIIKCTAYVAITFRHPQDFPQDGSVAAWLKEIAKVFQGRQEVFSHEQSVIIAIDPVRIEKQDDIIAGEACQYLFFSHCRDETAHALNVQTRNPASAGAIINTNGLVTLFRGRSGAQTSYGAWDDDVSICCSNLCFLNNLGLEIGYDSIAWYLRYFYIPAPNTIYRRVFSIRPGEINCNGTSEEVAAIESLVNRRRDQVPRGGHIREVTTEDFEAQLKASCSNALRSPSGTAGLLLSGGKDSSALAVALSMTSQHVDCLTVGFPGFDLCENADAAAVANALGLTHRTFSVGSSSVLKKWNRFISLIGQPMGDPAAYPLFLGLDSDFSDYRLFLDGTGNDSYFGLMPSFRSRMAWYLQRTLWMIHANRLLSYSTKFLASGSGRKFRQPPQDFYVSWQGFETTLIDEMFGTALPWSSLPLYDIFRKCSSPERHMTETVCGIWEPEAAYRKLVQTSSVLGKTIQYPFLDPQIRNLVLSASQGMRHANGLNKILLRKLLEKHLPRSVVNKPKGAFVFPVHQLLNIEQNPDLKELACESRWKDLGLGFIWNGVEPVISSLQYGATSQMGRLYALYVLFSWLRNENEGPARAQKGIPGFLKPLTDP